MREKGVPTLRKDGLMNAIEKKDVVALDIGTLRITAESGDLKVCKIDTSTKEVIESIDINASEYVILSFLMDVFSVSGGGRDEKSIYQRLKTVFGEKGMGKLKQSDVSGRISILSSKLSGLFLHNKVKINYDKVGNIYSIWIDGKPIEINDIIGEEHENI